MSELKGFAIGIIFCAWYAGLGSDQVALIRLPASIILTVFIVIETYRWWKSVRGTR